jgi:hypothetical protein
MYVKVINISCWTEVWRLCLSLLWCHNVPLSLQAYKRDCPDSEVQRPTCGYKLDPVDIDNQGEHHSRLTAKITEEMIADEDGGEGVIVFETVVEDSCQIADEEENDYFEKDDRRD